MAYEVRPGSFSLFRNDRKEKDNHPDYTGNGALPDGTEAWINAWLKETRDGKKFFSISIKPKDEQRGGGGGGSDFRDGSMDRGGSGGMAGNDRAGDFDPNDEIPFATSLSVW